MARRLFIASSANPRIRALRRLARRVSPDICLAEGARAVEAALAAGVEVREVYLDERLLLGRDTRRLAGRAEQCGARVIEVAGSVFETVTRHIRSDGLLAIVARPRWDLGTLEAPPDSLLAVAVGIERPGNLGTIIRTACAAGADGIIAADPCTDLYHPDVIRGSVGTVFATRGVAATTSDALAWLAQRRFRIVAASPGGEVDYARGDYRGNVAVVFGSERHGLPPCWLEAADQRVVIPMSGGADSLNVAVASGVVLFQAVVDRGRPRSSSW